MVQSLSHDAVDTIEDAVGSDEGPGQLERWLRRPTVTASRDPSWEVSMSEENPPLTGKRVAVLVEEGFDRRELFEPLEALRAAGAQVSVVGPTAGATFHDKRAEATITSDLGMGAATAREFDAVVIPGGHAPDRMRLRHAMVDLARDAMTTGRVVAAICHGPQLLISADVLRGRTLTCWPSIAVDVKNAGGLYIDKPVVTDGNLITSRKPDDVPLFSQAIIRALGGPDTQQS